MAKDMTKKELREWMNFYHDQWIKDHNLLVEQSDAHVCPR